MSGIVWVNSFLFSTQPLISVVLSLKCPEGFKLPNPLLPPPTRDSLQTVFGAGCGQRTDVWGPRAEAW